ncbi:hypothetical protein Sbs19_32850 [Sphingobium sp. BS19]|nr:hypothetical protein Sbs19_32850 [Sphingobium sp. BS19]
MLITSARRSSWRFGASAFAGVANTTTTAIEPIIIARISVSIVAVGKVEIALAVLSIRAAGSLMPDTMDQEHADVAD